MAGPFEISIRQFAERSKERVDVVHRRVVLEIASRIIVRSPVKSGRFRGNWRVADQVVSNGPIDREDPSGEATMADIMRALDAGKFTRRWVIYNNLPYGPRLETGWSKQAPIGMVALTLLEFSPIVDGVAQGLDSISVGGIGP
jgi:hypothetical protein